MQKTIISILGKSNVGKSTLTKELAKRMPGIYIVSYDQVKRQLSGYHRDKDKGLVQSITFGFFEVICKQGLSVLLDGFIASEEMYKKYLKIGQGFGYTFHSVHLEAPLEVVLKRFRERIKRCEEQGIKISVMDEGLFLENQMIDYFVPQEVTVFDTSKINVETIADRVMENIKG